MLANQHSGFSVYGGVCIGARTTGPRLRGRQTSQLVTGTTGDFESLRDGSAPKYTSRTANHYPQYQTLVVNLAGGAKNECFTRVEGASKLRYLAPRCWNA